MNQTGEDFGSAATDPSGLSKLHVLVVDDERVMRDLMQISLNRLGYAVTTTADGLIALDLLEQKHFDLVMLDVMMPRMDGFTVLARLREFSAVPVVMLTVLNRPEDVVRGFELGADNYITKPFNFKEVEARIQAMLRRTTHLSDGASFEVAEFGDLKLFNDSEAAEVAGRRVDLTPNEFALLRYLATHAEHPIGKDELLQEVWQYDDKESANLVELAIRRLRTKIETDASAPARLITVRGVGYMYVTHRAGEKTPAR